MKTSIEGNNLHIIIPLCKPRPSRSGKTLIVASTEGPERTSVEINGKAVTVNVNAYIFKD